MLTADAILRLMAASLEALAVLIDKATPEQVQAVLERHNRRMERLERRLDRLGFWKDDDAPG